MSILQGIGDSGKKWLDFVGGKTLASSNLFEDGNVFDVFNYKVSQVLVVALLRNNAKILYFGNVASLEFFELFSVSKKGLLCCFRGKRDSEDFEDNVSFFTLLILAKVSVAQWTFVKQSDDSIVADALWSCVSHVGALSP